VGAALIHRGSCQGCHITIDAQEIDQIRNMPADAIARCDQCRRILVRTAESGL
jgi:predicted  nucleic acid-binding Zn-ribbon protein